ncbi:MAG TPA: hypothetical protein VE173_00040 [Longimicrobiales bacterium]|jgi:hypothetical protein|nr:hypothetical protein [Longimicrobiales bacterium]
MVARHPGRDLGVAGRGLLLALSALLAGCRGPTAPDAVEAWEPADSRFDGTTILDAAYGNGTFVIVGLRGHVATSPDAREWTRRDGPFDSHITGVTFSEGFGRFVAASHDDSGQGRTIAISERGRVWVRRPTPRPEPMREVTCARRVCVAVGDEGGVLRSADLLTWEDVSFTGGGFRWISVIHARGEFVATGGREQVARSVDGRSWSVGSIGATADMDPGCTLGPDCNDIDDISFTGTRYVAVTQPTLRVWVSADLKRWEPRITGLPELPLPFRGLWVTMSVGGVSFVGGGGGKLAASYDDGDRWQVLDPGFATDGIWALARGRGLYLVAGEGGRLATAAWR